VRSSAAGRFTVSVNMRAENPSEWLGSGEPIHFAGGAAAQNLRFSETVQFTLMAQGKSQDMILEIEGTQLHANRCWEAQGRFNRSQNLQNATSWGLLVKRCFLKIMSCVRASCVPGRKIKKEIPVRS
jgi:hypothetical protein